MSRPARFLGRPRRRGVVAFAGVAMLLFLATLPVVAATGPSLSGASISPTTGPAGTTFTVRVTYTSPGRFGHGWAPSFVRVALGGTTFAMHQADSGDHDYANGATFQAVLKPAAGSYHVVISAADSHHDPRPATSLDLGTLLVGPTATPRPTPTLKPTPEPTPKPTPQPTPRPTARPTPAPRGEATPTPGVGSGGAPAADTPSPSPIPLVLPSLFPTPSAAPTSSPTAAPAPSPSPLAAGPIANAGGTGAGGVTLAALTASLPPLGSAAWFELLTRQLAIAVGGSTMVAMAMFTFRRRQETEPAADPAAPEPVAPRLADQLPAAYVAQPPLGALPGEAEMPRWRRPSLRAARTAKPGSDLGVIAAQRLTFADDPATATPGAVRRRLRYRMVRLSDGPDEIRSRELGLLDQGDEVELLQQSGVYWQVRTPLGQVGWIHRMTLGDVVVAGPPPTPPAWRSAAPGAVDGAAAREEADALEDPTDAGEGLAHRLARERFTL